MTDLTNLLADIRARVDGATGGPWAVECDEDEVDGHAVYVDDGITWGRSYVAEQIHQQEDDGKADASFIAHARTDVPRLLAALEGVVAACDAIIDNTDGHKPPGPPHPTREQATACRIRAAVVAALGEGE